MKRLWEILNADPYSYRYEPLFPRFCITLRDRPDNVATHVQRRLAESGIILKDFDWWWVALDTGIQISIREKALLKCLAPKPVRWVKSLRPHQHFPNIRVLCWKLEYER